MLRGTNKRAIEVINTENDYFERIIFIVKNEKRNTPEPELRRQAHSYMTLNGTRIRRAVLVRSALLTTVLKMMVVAAAGAAVTGVCLLLFVL